MKDEIKEILDKLKIKSDRYNHHLKYNMPYENKDEDYEAHLLLDCITNLQEELKETSDLCSKYFVKIQVLKEELKSANESITWWQNRFMLYKKKIKDYIEIKRDEYSNEDNEWWFINRVLEYMEELEKEVL